LVFIKRSGLKLERFFLEFFIKKFKNQALQYNLKMIVQQFIAGAAPLSAIVPIEKIGSCRFYWV